MNGMICRAARAAMGLTIQQLADLARISAQTVSRIEHDASHRQNRTTLDALHRAFARGGVTIEEFKGGFTLTVSYEGKEP